MMAGMSPTPFRKAAGNDAPSWYLDPLVAVQKRQVHQEWIRAAVGRRPCATALKTDLFEDAYGDDWIFHDLLPGMRLGLGFDLNPETVSTALRRSAGAFQGFAGDVRRLALPDARVDVVVSTSTLDHLESKREIADALEELSRVVRADGLLIVTLDNPRNPFYFILKWLSRRGGRVFPLGATLTMEELEGMLVERGFQVKKRGYLIHNPRVLSTVLFLGLRRLLGRRADTPIRWLLSAFMWMGGLPTQSFTGCFLAVSAVKLARTGELIAGRGGP
jgi:SAM-dependent methyltransferase